MCLPHDRAALVRSPPALAEKAWRSGIDLGSWRTCMLQSVMRWLWLAFVGFRKKMASWGQRGSFVMACITLTWSSRVALLRTRPWHIGAVLAQSTSRSLLGATSQWEARSLLASRVGSAARSKHALAYVAWLVEVLPKRNSRPPRSPFHAPAWQRWRRRKFPCCRRAA